VASNCQRTAAAIVVCIAARLLNKNVDDDYCACRVKADGGGGYS